MIALFIVICFYISPFIYGTLKLAHFPHANIQVPCHNWMWSVIMAANCFSATVTTCLYISHTGESTVVHKRKRNLVFCVNCEIKLEKGSERNCEPLSALSMQPGCKTLGKFTSFSSKLLWHSLLETIKLKLCIFYISQKTAIVILLQGFADLITKYWKMLN